MISCFRNIKPGDMIRTFSGRNFTATTRCNENGLVFVNNRDGLPDGSFSIISCRSLICKIFKLIK